MEQTLDPTLEPAQLRALELLRRGRRFVIAGHERPDGDCLGSQASLAHVLLALGKHVVVLNPDPPEPRFDYLAAGVPFAVWSGGELPEHDVAVTVDFAELSRAGELGEQLGRAESKKLVVDHHIPGGAVWWDEAFVDSRAAASGLLVHRIARALEVPLDLAAARAVFTSIVTDTGWFKYSNTDQETLAVASEMVRLGVEPAELYRALFQVRSPDQPRYVQCLLATLEYHAEGRIALVRETLAARGDERVDADDVLDILRSVAAVEVVLYVREAPEGRCKLSARSKGEYDVHALARAFGGGGHRKAAGATLKGSLDQACRAVIEAALAGYRAPAGRPARG
jgi:phosphoesterase RecJ-like protein